MDATSQMNTVALPAGAFNELQQYLILPEVKDAKNWRGGKNPLHLGEESTNLRLFTQRSLGTVREP